MGIDRFAVRSASPVRSLCCEIGFAYEKGFACGRVLEVEYEN